MCMCIYIYIYVYTYIHIVVLTYTHMYVIMHTIYIYIYTHTCTYIYIYIHAVVYHITYQEWSCVYSMQVCTYMCSHIDMRYVYSNLLCYTSSTII